VFSSDDIPNKYYEVVKRVRKKKKYLVPTLTILKILCKTDGPCNMQILLEKRPISTVMW
jgi:hypothetical protein